MDKKTLKHLINKRNRLGKSMADTANCLGMSFDLYVKFESGSYDLDEIQKETLYQYLEITELDLGILPSIEKYVPKSPIGALKFYQTTEKPKLFFNFKYYFKAKNDITFKEKIEKELFHPEDLNTNKPVLFIYAFVMLLVLFALSFGIEQYVLSNLFLSMIIPVTLLIFMHEMHLPRTIKGIDTLKYFILGGILAIGMTYIIRYFSGYPEGLIGDLTTGFVEEFAKIIICLLIFSKLNIRHVTTGILIGFAVGVGFDVFETSDYGMIEFLETGEFYAMISNITFRSIYALFGIGHHFWTGILAGMLVVVNTNTKISYKDFFKPAFLMMFVFVSIIHALWNYYSGFTYGIDFIILAISLMIFIRFLSVHMQNDHLLLIESKMKIETENLDINT
jgi:RsiW-degrading membrane proteinase PrsW (M82 family)